MNTINIRTLTVSLLTSNFLLLTSYFLLLTPSSAQGPLTPPGAPAPGMRALDQIEPRIPITELPYTINQPGSYIVTGPLSSTNHGILVQAHNVTVDLMGFTITGTSSTNFHGILAQGGDGIPLRNVHIRNGGVWNFGDGVRFENVNGGSIRHLSVLQNAGRGIAMLKLPSPASQTQRIAIEYCELVDNGGDGLFIGTLEATSNGFSIRHNIIRGNNQMGIRVFRLVGSVVTDNFIGPQSGADTYAFFAHQSLRNFIGRNISVDNDDSFSTGGSVSGPHVNKELGILSDTGTESHPHANFNIRPD